MSGCLRPVCVAPPRPASSPSVRYQHFSNAGATPRRRPRQPAVSFLLHLGPFASPLGACVKLAPLQPRPVWLFVTQTAVDWPHLNQPEARRFARPALQAVPRHLLSFDWFASPAFLNLQPTHLMHLCVRPLNGPALFGYRFRCVLDLKSVCCVARSAQTILHPTPDLGPTPDPAGLTGWQPALQSC